MKKLLTLFALVAALLLTSSGAWAATYYVDGQNGSDSNDGETPSTAWKHINYAMSQIEEEDVVMVDYAVGNAYD